MASRTLTVGVVQQRCGERRDENLAAGVAGIREAARRGARLVLLPELHALRYFCQTEDPALFDLAEPVPGPTTEALARVAAELHVVLVASVFERRAPGLHHNTAAVLDADGRLAGLYRKMHVPDDPGYYEKFYFAPGDLGFEPVPSAAGRLGVQVCWDQWYPEGARLMALRGADLLCYPTAIGWSSEDDPAEQARQREAWRTIQRAHAIANGLCVLVANRTGHEPDPSGRTDGIRFWGSSFVAGPQGEILAEAADDPAVLVAELDLGRSEEVRRIWPYLRDRRVDAYGDLARRWRD
ncbi:MAG TPA: acyltransferase [Candidatus Rokubacteria bacterium]|nr:acyltransferase [Candidatus Rokubacteria bacterium]